MALVGFPNVGKSTLISRISAAKPKVADYPFTTLEPHLGVVRMDDGAEYVVADVPGLIEGASEGRGLGHRFLRHIERARVLCVLLDLAPVAERPPAEQLAVLLDELEAYDPELAARHRLVVGSRGRPGRPRRRPGRRPRPAHLGRDRRGHRRAAGPAGHAGAATPGTPSPRPSTSSSTAPCARVTRAREGAGWVVEGREAARAVALSDLTRPDALAEAHRRLQRLGIDRALARAGAQPGDTVRIGGLVFEYEDDEGGPP